MTTIIWNHQPVPVPADAKIPPRAVVDVPGEGRAEVMKILRYLGGGRYRARVRFLFEVVEVEREIDIGKGGGARR
jgi:hypothetical protein